MQIVKFGTITEEQKAQAVDLFMAGFGKFMTFSKDENLKKTLFKRIFDPSLFFCYIEENMVLGLMGLATNSKRPICFEEKICRELFGSLKGSIISHQMNAIFQKPVVKNENELYLDVLVTEPLARRSGVGSKLIQFASNLSGYNVLYTEVFSKNMVAINFYEKNGFTAEKEEKFSLLRLQGEGYPIKMKKTY